MPETKFINSRVENEEITTFRFEKPTNFTYLAGQFIELTLTLPQDSTEKHKRWFTLSSSPSESFLSITTRIKKDNPSDFKIALQQLKPGELVHISQPMGDFVLPRDPDTAVIFIAGGIGITPYVSMIQWLASNDDSRSVKLIYSSRNIEDMIFIDLFKQYDCELILFPASPPQNWKGDSGKITKSNLMNLVDQKPEARIYMSGPEPFTETIYDTLIELGYNETQLVTDYFPGYSNI